MYNRDSRTTRLSWAAIVIACLMLGLNLMAADRTIFYDKDNADLKTVEFGVGDLTQALTGSGLSVVTKDIGQFTGSETNCFAFTRDASVGQESYTISISGSRYECRGDRVGLMYGAFELAENVKNSTLGSLGQGKRSPHLEKRGLKLNIPLDARTPSYADFGTAAQKNIPEMWSMKFWTDQLDRMARNRYNCYTLWNLHPFPSMVKVADYPDVALNDVMVADIDVKDKNDGYNTKGIDMVDGDVLSSLKTVKKMTIGQKIQFWKDVMQYGRDRGIEFHIYTWNVFVWGAGGKDGIITNDQLVDYRDNWSGFRNKSDYDTLVDYFYKSTKALFETYPLLAGIGVTAGEGFGDASDSEEEEFLADTYGKATLDFMNAPGNSDRKITFVHRAHQADDSLIVGKFGSLIDHPRITFDYSTKYVNARLYSYVGKDQGQKDVTADKAPPGGKWWLNIRNDDIFNFRWGDYDFAKTFIEWINLDKNGDSLNGDEDALASIRGFHMGPDGYVFGREFTDKNPDTPRQLEHDKHWLKFMLWGRLGYDPNTPETIFNKEAGRRLGISNATSLMNAWKEASKIIPAVNRQRYTKLDYQFHPEYNIARKGLKGWQTLEFWEDKEGGDSKLADTPDELEGYTKDVLDALPGLRAASSGREYTKTLDDLECLAHLGNFYANHMRAAYYLRQGDNTKSQQYSRAAVGHWNKLARKASTMYTGQVLGRVTVGNWEDLYMDALADLDDSSDFNKLPTVSITSPTDGQQYHPAPADIAVTVSASDPDGNVAKVELLLNGTLVSTEKSAPYTFSLSSLGVGTHTIEARAYDNDDGLKTATITIDVIDDIGGDLESIPWIEKFTFSNGTTSDSGSTSWSAVADDGVFSVQNNALTVNDGDGVLKSGLINISGGPVEVSLDVQSEGGVDAGQDYVRLYAKVNGGAEVLIGEVTGDANETIKGTVEGAKLQLVIRAYVSWSTEYYHMDNLSVISLGLQKFSLKVNNGTGDGNYTEGSSVSISADAPPADKVFDAWTGDTASVVDINKASTTVTMPGEAVTVTATYKDAGGNQAPDVGFATPSNGDTLPVGTNLYVKANATDSDGAIANVKLYINDTYVRREKYSPYEWGKDSQNDALLQNMAAGNYTLKLVAEDNEGTTTSKSISITIGGGNAVPTASFITPVNGDSISAGSDLYVKIDAADSDGSISNAKLYINDVYVRKENRKPYEWGAVGQNDPLLQNMAPGVYTLKVIVTDNSGAATETTITITVGSEVL